MFYIALGLAVGDFLIRLASFMLLFSELEPRPHQPYFAHATELLAYRLEFDKSSVSSSRRSSDLSFNAFVTDLDRRPALTGEKHAYPV